MSLHKEIRTACLRVGGRTRVRQDVNCSQFLAVTQPPTKLPSMGITIHWVALYVDPVMQSDHHCLRLLILLFCQNLWINLFVYWKRKEKMCKSTQYLLSHWQNNYCYVNVCEFAWSSLYYLRLSWQRAFRVCIVGCLTVERCAQWLWKSALKVNWLFSRINLWSCYSTVISMIEM